MRAKRAKQYRKLMRAYQISFNFREPYQVLIDGDFIRAAARFKMKLGAMLEGTLSGGSIKPMITQASLPAPRKKNHRQCCIRHLYTAPAHTEAEQREKAGWIEAAKQAERRRCGHHELASPLSALECLRSVVDGKGSGTNKHRYVVASQDPEVRACMRLVAGVPIVYINRSVMILEPMAARSEEVRAAEERGKVRAGLKGGRGTGAGIKRRRAEEEDVDDVGGDEGSGTVKKRKVKGPKEPNPLSVKKAKDERPKAKPVVTKGTHEDREDTSGRAVLVDGDETTGNVVEGVSTSIGSEGKTADGVRKRKRRKKPREKLDESDHTGVGNDTRTS